jgi:hypothetical protein
MFQYNLTTSGKTLAAILKENNADKHFQFEDYNAAVADKNLTPDLETLFKGYLGPNFGGAIGFNNSHPILCQLDCKAPKSTNQRRTIQWALFFPHMNTVLTCHDCIDSGRTKHAWVLGSKFSTSSTTITVAELIGAWEIKKSRTTQTTPQMSNSTARFSLRPNPEALTSN